MKKIISMVLVCSMILGMASVTSCKKDEVPNDKTETPKDPADPTDPTDPTDPSVPASTLVIKYGGDENMESMKLTVGEWSEAANSQANWTAMENGQVMFDADNKAECRPALLTALQAGKKYWFCIANQAPLVKYFHVVTAEELAAGEIVLPDKDGGNTMIMDELIDGKPYKNDWVVTLYMGINGYKQGKPVFWATGNLVAVKTGGANEPSDPEFYLATLAENAEQAKGSGENPYNKDTEGVEASFSKTDGYEKSPKGYRWDSFLALDASGVRTDYRDSDNDADVWCTKKLREVEPDQTKWSFGGKAGADIATAQLKGEWSLPSRWDAAVIGGTGIVASSAVTGGQLPQLIYTDLTKSKLVTEGSSVYWEVEYTTADGFKNVIRFPGAGVRRWQNNKFFSARGQNVTVMSSGLAPGQPNVMVFESYTQDNFAAGHYMNNFYVNILCPVRPVTE